MNSILGEIRATVGNIAISFFRSDYCSVKRTPDGVHYAILLTVKPGLQTMVRKMEDDAQRDCSKSPDNEDDQTKSENKCKRSEQRNEKRRLVYKAKKQTSKLLPRLLLQHLLYRHK